MRKRIRVIVIAVCIIALVGVFVRFVYPRVVHKEAPVEAWETLPAFHPFETEPDRGGSPTDRYVMDALKLVGNEVLSLIKPGDSWGRSVIVKRSGNEAGETVVAFFRGEGSLDSVRAKERLARVVFKDGKVRVEPDGLKSGSDRDEPDHIELRAVLTALPRFLAQKKGCAEFGIDFDTSGATSEVKGCSVGVYAYPWKRYDFSEYVTEDPYGKLTEVPLERYIARALELVGREAVLPCDPGSDSIRLLEMACEVDRKGDVVVGFARIQWGVMAKDPYRKDSAIEWPQSNRTIVGDVIFKANETLIAPKSLAVRSARSQRDPLYRRVVLTALPRFWEYFPASAGGASYLLIMVSNKRTLKQDQSVDIRIEGDGALDTRVINRNGRLEYVPDPLIRDRLRIYDFLYHSEGDW